MFRSYGHEKVSLRGSIITLLFVAATFTLLIYAISMETMQQTETVCINKNKVSSWTRTKRLPQALIIGSRKSGTRALLKFLELNPAVRAANNEPHFFDKDRNYKLGLEWYRSQMPESGPGEVTLEKSPAYFVTRGAAERVRAMNASIKLIVIFRDPVTRLISDFSQLVANRIEAGDLEGSSLGEEYDGSEEYPASNSTPRANQVEAAWRQAEHEFQLHVLRPDGGINEQRRLVRTSMYSQHLERWKSAFPNENQFHFVDGELLIKSPHEELHRLELFLGLKPTIKPYHFVFSNKKGFYCLKRSNSSTTQGGECLSKSKGRRHVVVADDLIAKLRRFYSPYNEYLYSLTGRDFGWPKENSVA